MEDDVSATAADLNNLAHLSDTCNDDDLFAPPPPMPDCPSCFLPLPISVFARITTPCCGATICGGCHYASGCSINETNNKRLTEGLQLLEESCPFCCRTKVAKNDKEILVRTRKRMKLIYAWAVAQDLGDMVYPRMKERHSNSSFVLLSWGRCVHVIIFQMHMKRELQSRITKLSKGIS